MENRILTLGSLFDGSGGFPLGGLLNGIKPLWASEIAPVDIITFGSPCVDMSIAGKRKGLNASRSGLFFQAVRIVREMREATEGRYPRFVAWENVTDAFSSNKGADFREVIQEIVNGKKFAGKKWLFIQNVGYIENTVVTCEYEHKKQWFEKLYHHPKEKEITGITKELPVVTKEMLMREIHIAINKIID